MFAAVDPSLGRPFGGWLASLCTRCTGEIVLEFPFLGNLVDAIPQVDPINNPTQASKGNFGEWKSPELPPCLDWLHRRQEEACLIKVGGPGADW